MKILLLCFILASFSAQACVTYNPATRTYTVDGGGNVKSQEKNERT